MCPDSENKPICCSFHGADAVMFSNKMQLQAGIHIQIPHGSV